jgi:hypothetical protein
MKEHAEKLPDNEKNPGGIYQLYCAMSGRYNARATGPYSVPLSRLSYGPHPLTAMTIPFGLLSLDVGLWIA